MRRSNEFYKVWYYFTNDEEGKIHSTITMDVEHYEQNNPFDTGIEVFSIEKSTEKDYYEQFEELERFIAEREEL